MLFLKLLFEKKKNVPKKEHFKKLEEEVFKNLKISQFLFFYFYPGVFSFSLCFLLSVCCLKRCLEGVT